MKRLISAHFTTPATAAPFFVSMKNPNSTEQARGNVAVCALCSQTLCKIKDAARDVKTDADMHVAYVPQVNGSASASMMRHIVSVHFKDLATPEQRAAFRRRMPKEVPVAEKSPET